MRLFYRLRVLDFAVFDPPCLQAEAAEAAAAEAERSAPVKGKKRRVTFAEMPPAEDADDAVEGRARPPINPVSAESKAGETVPLTPKDCIKYLPGPKQWIRHFQ